MKVLGEAATAKALPRPDDELALEEAGRADRDRFDSSRRDRSLWETARIQTERVYRLEADLWEAIRRGCDGSN